MAEKSGKNVRGVGAAILLVVAAANLGYAIYRMTTGEADNAPLIIGGVICGAMAAVLLGTGKAKAGKD